MAFSTFRRPPRAPSGVDHSFRAVAQALMSAMVKLASVWSCFVSVRGVAWRRRRGRPGCGLGGGAWQPSVASVWGLGVDLSGGCAVPRGAPPHSASGWRRPQQGCVCRRPGRGVGDDARQQMRRSGSRRRCRDRHWKSSGSALVSRMPITDAELLASSMARCSAGVDDPIGRRVSTGCGCRPAIVQIVELRVLSSSSLVKPDAAGFRSRAWSPSYGRGAWRWSRCWSADHPASAG